MGVSILQWNCRGLRSRFDDVRHLLSSFSPVCLCLQETKLRAADVLSLRRYSIFRHDHFHPGIACGGVAIIVPHHVPVQQLSLTTSLQAVAVRLSLNVLLTICCVYLPPGLDVSLSALDGLVSQLPSPLLLLGDFNAHNPLWGGGCLDTMGRHVADLLSSCHLCMFNTGADTYFHQPTRTFSQLIYLWVLHLFSSIGHGQCLMT
ncbi:endonuclease/exonuclease/phosphatase family protein [Salmonella enterica subsp. enterica serovar Albany]|nr:endonuclease/exonuclease/phosphatase family protein [Salmonella enterica subsp. enterica serovar Albany]